MRLGRAVVGFFVLLIIIGAIAGEEKSTSSDSKPDTSTGDSSCENSWRECRSLSQLLENNTQITTAQARCETVAEEAAKYGEPEFPWVPFGAIKRTEKSLNTGVVTLVEDDAEFQNAFGTMKHVQVVCTYDLKREKVLDLNVIE